MTHQSHAHGQCELSCTAGVMLNVRWSDRNANQVSKLTPHSHRCTSDLQWFISQSESMCHCVESSWVNMARAKVRHLAAAPSAFPSSMNNTLHESHWWHRPRVTFKTGRPHAMYLGKSLKSALKGYYNSRRQCSPYFKWFPLLSKPWHQHPLPSTKPHLHPPDSHPSCPRIRGRTESRSRPQLSDRHSQSFIYLLNCCSPLH